MLRTVCDLTYLRLTGLTLVLFAIMLSPADVYAIPTTVTPQVPSLDGHIEYQTPHPWIGGYEDRLPSNAHHLECEVLYHQCLLAHSEDPERAEGLFELQENLLAELDDLRYLIDELEEDLKGLNEFKAFLDRNDDQITEVDVEAEVCEIASQIWNLSASWYSVNARLLELHHEIYFTHDDPAYSNLREEPTKTCLNSFRLCEVEVDDENRNPEIDESSFVQSKPQPFFSPAPVTTTPSNGLTAANLELPLL